MKPSPNQAISDQRLAVFFTKYIDGWLLHDIRFCAEQKENLSFAVATLVFNAIDFLGGLCAGRDSDRNTFRLFLEKYLASYVSLNPEIDIYDSYRCGLVHEYFPKDQHGIVWNASDHHLKQRAGHYTLDAQSLVMDLEGAIAAYKADLDRDRQLQDNFMKRMNTILPPEPPKDSTLTLGNADVGRSDSMEIRGYLFGEGSVLLTEPPKD